MGLANLLRPEPFKCKKKGDSEQLLQDFKEYRSKMELFFTAAKAVEEHTGDPAGRAVQGHTVCTSCRQDYIVIECTAVRLRVSDSPEEQSRLSVPSVPAALK